MLSSTTNFLHKYKIFYEVFLVTTFESESR